MTKFVPGRIIKTDKRKGRSIPAQRREWYDTGDCPPSIRSDLPAAGAEGRRLCSLYKKAARRCLENAGTGIMRSPAFPIFPMEKPRLKMKAYYLFSIDGRGYYYVREMLQEEGNGYEFCPTSVYRTMKPMYQAFAGIRPPRSIALRKAGDSAAAAAMKPRTARRSGPWSAPSADRSSIRRFLRR